MQLIPIESTDDHYKTCKLWLEDREITKWLTSVLRYSKYPRMMHEMLISTRKNRLFFISVQNKRVGLVGLINIDRVDKRAEIFCFVGSQSHQNKGIATQALNRMKKLAVVELKLHTLYGHLVESNAASVRLMEKIGFQNIGKYRKAFFIDGTFKDMLAVDWVREEGI